jgi:hypothetical protein
MTYLMTIQIMFAFLGVATVLVGLLYFKENPKKLTKSELNIMFGFFTFTGLMFIYSAYVLGL